MLAHKHQQSKKDLKFWLIKYQEFYTLIYQEDFLKEINLFIHFWYQQALRKMLNN